MSQMSAYHLDRPGSIEGLVRRSREIPQPGRGEVLVRMRAVALNFRDLMIVNDQYGFPIRPGLVPLSDGAGEVAAVGDGVTRFAKGSRVVVNFMQNWIAGDYNAEVQGSDVGGSIEGIFAEYVVLPEYGLVPLSARLSYEEGASLACAGLTAWSGLVGQKPVNPGEIALVQGTGGVSIFALQFAKLFGMRVIATTSSEAKARRLKELGADEVINYVETPEWDRKVLELSGGRGVDRVIEVGGPGTLERSVRAVRVGGRIALIGFVAGMEGAINPVSLIIRAANIDAIAVGSRRDFEAMMRAIDFHGMHPVIDKVFPFDAAQEAYRHLQSRTHVGKVVIRVGS